MSIIHTSSKTTANDHLLHEQASRLIEGERFRLAPIWPKWNETEINTESWDVAIIKRRDTNPGRTRTDTKTNVSLGGHAFEDPEGKIELPPSFKIEQWKRPIEFLTSEKPPVIVDPDLGIQNFDLVTSNEHLHHSETMRNIISQITALWNICRKTTNTTSGNINERTWRPWEHIYALNKVSKQPFITPYNPAGKYVVRLFFLGTWRKITIDDSIPFDSKNQCLLPQTSLSYELWPMLLTKALLKILSLDFNPSNDFPEYNETSIIHSLTSWIPEPIPLKYTHAEKIWNFLRYDRSNKLVCENDNLPSFGPIPLFKWPDPKTDLAEETSIVNENHQLDQQDDRSSKKEGTSINLTVPKDPTAIKSTNIKENRTSGSNPNAVKDTKKSGVSTRGISTEDAGAIVDDQISPEAPKLIVFATMPHLQSTRISSYSETADRSERLRRYNLNDTFSTSILLTSIRDIPLEPPPPIENIPSWKLIRPRKPKVLPHAEPVAPQESKPERWIEMSSPYINYPTASALTIKPTFRLPSIDNNITTVNTSSRLNRSVKHVDSSNITKIDEDEDIGNRKIKAEVHTESVGSITNLNLTTPKRESNAIDTQEKLDESIRNTGYKLKREISADKTKIRRKSVAPGRKISLDTASTKSKSDEIEPFVIPVDVQAVGNNIEQQNSQLINQLPLENPKIWMNFDDFCACFTSIIVFHNPRGYQYAHKHTEIKFTPYQPPLAKERRKEPSQLVIQPIPNLQDDKSTLYLFVDSTRETLDKNIELIISLTCLSRWYDALPSDTVGSNEKTVRGASLSTEKPLIDANPPRISQKDIIPQAGSLIAELYSWKSLSMGQPILRLHTKTTKAALLTLPPGRHVLKFVNTCPFAFHLQILSDINDFMLGDEDQLLNKITSVPDDAECIIRGEELFQALDDSVQNFHLIGQQANKLHDLFRLYCEQTPKSINLTIEACINTFNQALYSTLRTIISTSGSIVNPDTQFAWRCFTNDLSTPDILSAYETKPPAARSASRHSARASGSPSVSTGGPTTSKKSSVGRDKSSDDKASSKQQSSLARSSPLSEVQDSSSDLLTRELTINEIASVTNIQKSARGFLQRRIILARTAGTEKNLLIQRILQSTMSLLKVDSIKSAALLFKNFLSMKPQLIQCFSFRTDDWNMVTYRDYHGIYQKQPANPWFVLFREIFYVTTESLIVAKFLSHLSNSILRVINNDTYEEMPLVFNRLAPGMFTKNKYGYTFFAEGLSHDQSILNGRFRLRLITSYTHLPDIRVDQITSAFIPKEITGYYLPNKQQIICRYRVIFADDINQTGRNFHLATIRFNTSKSDVLIRLTVLDNDEELVSIEGKGCVVVPAILFMRTVTSIIQPQVISRPTSKTGGGTRKKDVGHTHRGNVADSNRSNQDRIGSETRSRSNSQTGYTTVDVEENVKFHKYIIQVTLLRKSWPLTPTQWQFVEQLKEQEKNELKISNQEPSSIKIDRSPSTSASIKRRGHANPNTSSSPTTGKGKSSTPSGSKSNATLLVRPSTAKSNIEKQIDKSKPHWILQVVSDADKTDELTIEKDTERNEELMNIKKAWETFQAGRAEKAMQTRQKFLDSLQINIDDGQYISDIHTDEETNDITPPPIIEQQQIIKKTSKKSSSSMKKGSVKDETSKQIELIPLIIPSIPQINEPLLTEPPPRKSELTLPLLDIKPFLKQKLLSNGPIISDSLFEQEDFERRQSMVIEYSKYMDEIRLNREDDYNHRYKEKIRQLEEYIDLQAKTDQTRRIVNQSHEAFRQRFFELAQKRRQELIKEVKPKVATKKNNPSEKKKE